MPSDLERVAQSLVESLDQVPQVVGHLQRLAARCREQASFVADLSRGSSAARTAALQLDTAARCCEEAAHLAAMTPAKARDWAMAMVNGVGPHRSPADTPTRNGLQLDLSDLKGRPRPAGEKAQVKPPATSKPARPGTIFELSTTDPDHKKSLNQPPSNSTVRVDDKFTFETDDLGRVIRASAILDVLDLNHPRDLTAQRKLTGKLPGDHAGHIFARIFRGPVGRMNLIPMEATKVNLGQYAVLEKRWRKAIENGEPVEVSVDLSYGERRHRPDIIVVYHRIGSGKRLRLRIRNVPKAEEE